NCGRVCRDEGSGVWSAWDRWDHLVCLVFRGWLYRRTFWMGMDGGVRGWPGSPAGRAVCDSGNVVSWAGGRGHDAAGAGDGDGGLISWNAGDSDAGTDSGFAAACAGDLQCGAGGNDCSQPLHFEISADG